MNGSVTFYLFAFDIVNPNPSVRSFSRFCVDPSLPATAGTGKAAVAGTGNKLHGQVGKQSCRHPAVKFPTPHLKLETRSCFQHLSIKNKYEKSGVLNLTKQSIYSFYCRLTGKKTKTGFVLFLLDKHISRLSTRFLALNGATREY